MGSAGAARRECAGRITGGKRLAAPMLDRLPLDGFARLAAMTPPALAVGSAGSGTLSAFETPREYPLHGAWLAEHAIPLPKPAAPPIRVHRHEPDPVQGERGEVYQEKISLSRIMFLKPERRPLSERSAGGKAGGAESRNLQSCLSGAGGAEPARRTSLRLRPRK